MTCVLIRWSAGRSDEPYTAVVTFNGDCELVEGAEAGSETESPPALVSTVTCAEVEAETAEPPALAMTKDPAVKYEADVCFVLSRSDTNFSPCLTWNGY